MYCKKLTGHRLCYGNGAAANGWSDGMVKQAVRTSVVSGLTFDPSGRTRGGNGSWQQARLVE